ncbi:MAG TPA: M23 family metallopeptidase [Mycobacterium sp.]|nr:M23 family metallopeptidase [Mycobacterium sp.]
MARHRSSTSPDGVSTNALYERAAQVPVEYDAEITDIIPFNEFGDLVDLEFRENCAFDRESQVIHAPELDDLHDTDDLIPLRLAVPSEFRPDAREERRSSHAYRDSYTDVSDGVAATDVIDIAGRRGLHRKPDVPVKGRLMVAAMAVGATAAGAYSMANAKEPTETVLAADQAVAGGVVTGSVDGMQVIAVTQAAHSAVHTEEIQKASAFAQERAEREARLQRPMYVMPTRGVWTSGFGYRWGVLHGGIDIANAIGTPILAASDGVVISAGPYAGYGNMVKLRHSDGTVTLYGHLSSVLVDVGERVWAGDQIAKMGNTGNSTGPHLHFEVLLNGTDRVDPVGWLAKRGIGPGNYSG